MRRTTARCFGPEDIRKAHAREAEPADAQELATIE
jgi:hypothetical protein